MSWELRNWELRGSMISPPEPTVLSWGCLWRNSKLLFGIYSQRAYTLLDVDASFALKMRMSEQNWTKIYLITANTIKIWQEHWAIKHFRLKWNYLTIASLYVWLGNISTFKKYFYHSFADLGGQILKYYLNKIKANLSEAKYIFSSVIHVCKVGNIIALHISPQREHSCSYSKQEIFA